MTFQFPKPFFGGLFVGSVIYPASFVSTGQPYKNTQNCVKSSKNHPVGADAFDSESLVVRNTFGAMLRMTTLWGQVLVFICRFVVYVS
jgi:hypothetical protein